jgi:CheY-like chemotaxis protein
MSSTSPELLLFVSFVTGWPQPPIERQAPDAESWSRTRTPPLGGGASVSGRAQLIQVTEKRPRILIADDAAEVRAVVRFTLQAHGWTVFEAATPAATLDLVFHEQPDAVLLDVVFGGHAIDGFAVCRKLRASPTTRDTPVVMLTARSTAADRDIADAAGATAYLSKPFGPLDLVRTLGDVLGVHTASSPLGVLLVDEGRVRRHQLEPVLEEQRRFESEGVKVPLGELLQRRGRISAADLERALERQRTADAPMPRAGKTRVLIADGHLAVRDGLRALLAEEDDIEVVGIAVDGDDALRLIRERRPDVALLDQELRKRTGLDVLEATRREGLATTVLIFSLQDELRERVHAAGAMFINKGADPRALVSEIRRIGPVKREPAALQTARAAPRAAWHLMRRERRAAGVLGVVMVGYAGAFLVAETVLGPSAALLAIVSVALAGALLGPEVGALAAFLATFETLVLWDGTGHLVGEPVLSVGGNGMGFLALIGIGGGFGAMRVLRGRLNSGIRHSETLIDAAQLMSGQDQSLAWFADAAREMTDADATLLYVSAGDGSLEVVATSGAPTALIGLRERADVGPLHRVIADAQPTTLDDIDSRSFIPSMHSALVVPICAVGQRPRGLVVTLATSRMRFSAADRAALLRLAPLMWLAVGSVQMRRQHTSRLERPLNTDMGGTLARR